MQKLPLGRQIFEEIRREDLLYVDKTRYIYDMIDSGIDQFFLSRPRCFGKTLLCWTLDALFSGKRELFEGLAISKTDWKWESYPVIHLNMSAVDTTCGVDGVMESLIYRLKKHSARCLDTRRRSWLITSANTLRPWPRN